MAKRNVTTDLLEALKGAKQTIKTWHNLSLVSMPKEFYEQAWALYDKNAPEMKPINAAIRKAEKGRAQ